MNGYYYRSSNPYAKLCKSCGRKTTKKYARENGGNCKACVTGDQSSNPVPDYQQAEVNEYLGSQLFGED